MLPDDHAVTPSADASSDDALLRTYRRGVRDGLRLSQKPADSVEPVVPAVAPVHMTEPVIVPAKPVRSLLGRIIRR